MQIFDYRGFLLVSFLFGGIVKVVMMDVATGVIEHGDPGYELRNQKPLITHHDRKEDAPDPSIKSNSGIRQNPFSE